MSVTLLCWVKSYWERWHSLKKVTQRMNWFYRSSVQFSPRHKKKQYLMMMTHEDTMRSECHDKHFIRFSQSNDKTTRDYSHGFEITRSMDENNDVLEKISRDFECQLSSQLKRWHLKQYVNMHNKWTVCWDHHHRELESVFVYKGESCWKRIRCNSWYCIHFADGNGHNDCNGNNVFHWGHIDRLFRREGYGLHDVFFEFIYLFITEERRKRREICFSQNHWSVSMTLFLGVDKHETSIIKKCHKTETCGQLSRQ